MPDTQSAMDKATVSITTDGHRYDMRLGDFSALDEFDYYKATGQSIMETFASGSITSFAVAGLVWLFRRRFEKTLRFEDVAAKLKFSDLDSVEVNDGSAASNGERPAEVTELEVAPNPEDSGEH